MSAGDSAAIMIVLALPPRLFCSSIVSTESRYGTRPFFLSAGSELAASAEMQLPRHVSDRLMAAPSFSRSPVAPVESARSLPARSMRLMTATLSLAVPAARSTRVCVSTIWKMVCARDDVAFMAVLATVRALVPASISCAMLA